MAQWEIETYPEEWTKSLMQPIKSLERNVRKRSQNKQLQHSRSSEYRVLLISGAGSSVAGSHCRTQVLA